MQHIKNYLNQKFYERSEEVDAILASLLARQHCILIGPPGTAKSQVVREICNLIDGATYFQWLLTKFTTPEELFGPYSLQELEKGHYRRIITGKLPEAHIVFLDEVFKASSAILNTLLTAMQERIFFNDSQTIQMPLISLFGASNELPQGEELGALYDRFLVRLQVNYISDDFAFASLLTAPSPNNPPKITLQELQDLQAKAGYLPIPDTIIEAIIKIRRALHKEGIIASDRRWKQSLDVLKAYTFLEQKPEVDEETLMFLQHCLWSSPEQRKTIVKVLGSVAAPHEAKAVELYDMATEIYQEAINSNEKEVSGIEANKKIKNILDQLSDLTNKHKSPKIQDIFQKVQAYQKEIIKVCLGVEI
ncbi:AAA family ATPase [Desulfonauticus submarinus]